MTRPSRGLRGLVPILLVLSLSCGIPRDPEQTLERARGDTLRVGAVDATPLLARAPGGATGPEADLIRELAQDINARVEWRWGSLDQHMEALASFELDIVAAGLTTASPWKATVGFTRPWLTEAGREYVLAVPPGENRILMALDRVIELARTRR